MIGRAEMRPGGGPPFYEYQFYYQMLLPSMFISASFYGKRLEM
jgi:hypothetical protein